MLCMKIIYSILTTLGAAIMFVSCGSPVEKAVGETEGTASGTNQLSLADVNTRTRSMDPIVTTATLLPTTNPQPTATVEPIVTPIPTASPKPTQTLVLIPTPTATPENYHTFINRNNGLIFVLPQTWEQKIESGGLQIFWSNADLMVLTAASSNQDLGYFVKNWFSNKPLFVETKRSEQRHMQIITGSLGMAYRQFVFIENAANDVSIFAFNANPDYLETYVPIFKGILDSIEIDASLIARTPTPSPTLTPPSIYTHVNGNQIPAKTVAGTNSCDQRFSDTAFCIELLIYEGVTEVHVQKAIDALKAIVGRYPVSESELKVTWPHFGPNGGIQNYLGYVIWNPETSSKTDIYDDLCMFRSISDSLHIKLEKDVCLSRVSGSLENTANGGANQGGAQLGHNGYVIHSATGLYETPLLSPAAPAKLLFKDPRKVAAHEYFHSYQDSHAIRIPGPAPASNQVPKTGPVWLMEGSAEYAAVRVSSLEGWMNWETQMKERMNVGENALAPYPNKFIGQHTTPEEKQTNDQKDPNMGHALSYELAIWAVAYAISISSQDAIMVNYWDDLEDYGYQESFRRNIGMSLKDFYISFREFRKQSLDQQYSSISSQIIE